MNTTTALCTPEHIYAAGQALKLHVEDWDEVSPDLIAHYMNAIVGAPSASGAWLWKQGYEAIEVALVLFLQEYLPPLFNSQTDPADLLGGLRKLEGYLTTQTHRSPESNALQQFSSPLGISVLADRAARITPQDLVLEPSAGLGLLAVFAQARGATLLLNELCPVRSQLLRKLFNQKVTAHDAEQINDYIEARPTAVLMNPPFSRSPHREERNALATKKHIWSALSRLQPGGRLVVITANWFSPDSSRQWVRNTFTHWQRYATVQLSIGLPGSAYRKFGTTVDTRLTVIDKIPTTAECTKVYGVTETLEAALELIEQHCPERAELTPCLPDFSPAVEQKPIEKKQKSKKKQESKPIQIPDIASGFQNIIEVNYLTVV